MTYSQPIRIDPDAIYDDRSACLALSISGSALAKGRRDGTLRHARKGNRTFYKGAWVLAWLESESSPIDVGASREAVLA